MKKNLLSITRKYRVCFLLSLVVTVVFGVYPIHLKAVESRNLVSDSITNINTKDAISLLSKCESTQHCQIGFFIGEVENGSTLLDYRGGSRMIPASVVKLISTGVALQYYGPNAKFITEVDYLGDIKSGTLYGDLIIRGSGDPSLGTKYINGERERFFTELLTSLKKVGIKAIDGKIIIDASSFKPFESSVQWLFEDLGEYYGVSLFGLNMYDNVIKCQVSALQDSTITVDFPDGFSDFLNVKNEINIDSYKDITVLGDPISNVRVLRGGISLGKSKEIAVSNGDPALYAAKLLTKYLNDKGVSISGNPIAYYRDCPKYDSSVDIFRFYSKPFSQLVKETNYRSLNLWANAFMGLLDQRLPKSIQSGLLIAQNYLTSKCEIDRSEFDLYDGCGLSPKDRITPSALASFLLNIYNAHPDVSTAFYYSLPLAGVEGSVKSFVLKPPLSARLKSGSMEGVQTYAGYVRKGGKDYIVVMMANGFTDRMIIRKTFSEALEKYFL